VKAPERVCERTNELACAVRKHTAAWQAPAGLRHPLLLVVPA
jgi:hypothetical protein